MFFRDIVEYRHRPSKDQFRQINISTWRYNKVFLTPSSSHSKVKFQQIIASTSFNLSLRRCLSKVWHVSNGLMFQLSLVDCYIEIYNFSFHSWINICFLVFQRFRVFNNFELKGAHFLAKKSTKRRSIFSTSKSAQFLVKGAQFLTSQTTPNNFYCIFMHIFFWRSKLLDFFPTLCRFIKIFPS